MAASGGKEATLSTPSEREYLERTYRKRFRVQLLGDDFIGRLTDQLNRNIGYRLDPLAVRIAVKAALDDAREVA